LYFPPSVLVNFLRSAYDLSICSLKTASSTWVALFESYIIYTTQYQHEMFVLSLSKQIFDIIIIWISLWNCHSLPLIPLSYWILYLRRFSPAARLSSWFVVCFKGTSTSIAKFSVLYFGEYSLQTKSEGKMNINFAKRTKKQLRT